VCQCNQTLNLLSRPEYFRLETNIPNNQLILSQLFTPPYTLTLIRDTNTIPTLTFSLIKGPVDLTSIRISNETTEFNAYITQDNPLGSGTITKGPIQSINGSIDQCLLRVTSIKLELPNLNITNSKQNLHLNLTTCAYTLRKFYLKKKRIQLSI